MYVFIEGRHKNKAVVEKYVDNLCRALQINRLQRLLTIRFKGTLDGGAQGLCHGEHDYAEVEIGTNGQTFMRQMQALAHEMVMRNNSCVENYPRPVFGSGKVVRQRITNTLTNLGKRKPTSGNVICSWTSSHSIWK